MFRPEGDNRVTKTVSIMMPVFLAVMLFSVPFVASDTADSSSVQSSEQTETQTDTGNYEIQSNQVSQSTHSGTSSETSSSRVENNSVVEVGDVAKEAVISAESFTNTSGIISINQAPGTMNNQSSSVTITVVEQMNDSHLQADAALQNYTSNNEVTSNVSQISNNIKPDAFIDTAGIITVNQSAGSMNTQSAMVNLVIGTSPVIALSDADLGMLNTGNRIMDVGVSRSDTISMFALQGVKGIISINQSSGCLNHQANVISISVRNFNLF